MDRDAGAAALRPNQLHVNHETRKPLFSNNVPRNTGNRVESSSASVGTGARPGVLGTAGHAGPTRRARSDPQSTTSGAGKAQQSFDPNASTASILSSGGSRIPRPNISGLQHRRPISLAEAFKLAREEEEEADRERQQGGSPSPAPRVWRARPGPSQDETRARKSVAEDPLDRKAGAQQFTGAKLSGSQSPISKPRATEPGAATSQRGNGPSLQDRINEWRTKSRPGTDWTEKSPESLRNTTDEARLPELVPGIEDVPFRSVESPGRNGAVTIASPSKDFTWQVDHDFTAGDLQVSDSPRIKIGNNSNRPFANRPSLLERIDIRPPTQLTSPQTRNTKLDEIRARELNIEGPISAGQSTLTPHHPRKYTKLDEIRAREAAAEKQIPIPDRNQLRPKNTRLDEIRQREADGLSRRALAAARLEEIKEKNAMARPFSPEKGKSRVGHDNFVAMRPPTRPRSMHEDGGERIPDTPVTVFKGRRPKQENINPDETGTVHGNGNSVASVKPEVDERDLLRRLARAASSSPAAEPVNRRAPLAERQKANESENVGTRPILAGRFTNSGRKPALISHTKDAESPSQRPTVGFAGLKRSSSTESAKSKRSSMHSESDPTARIEAEAKLFAPRDDYSEPGSVRAASPESDNDEAEDDAEDDAAEATPKPQKHEFPHMETPRVTGAYVETPATARVEKVKEEGREDIKSLGEKLTGSRGVASKPDAATLFRDKRTSLAWRSKDEDTASEPGARGGSADISAKAHAASKKARSRSLPRSRPIVKNSAKPPSVQEDLRELQRKHNIEDSTIDDLEDILSGRKQASPKLKQLLEELPVKPEDKMDDELRAVEEEMQKMKKGDSEDKDMSAGEMALFDKMSKTLRTGLSNIHTAKRGIERLEGQVANADKQSEADEDDEPKPPRLQKHQHAKDHRPLTDEPCPKCTAKPDPTSLAYFPSPAPKLLYISPRLLRWCYIGAAIVLLWCMAEWAVCGKYCRPTACTTTPCVYSYDDPTFGNALPVKLDQWTTGGNGRKLATWVLEELEDWAADVNDAVRGRSLEDIAVDQLSAAERRRHRRRLRKKGLVKPPTKAAPDQTAKWEAWRRSRLEKERLDDMGYETGDGWAGDGMGGDERVW
ncbi:uncharacterized protein MAM_05957 [Metarhizium album ARSEF 1941]|uniref:Uncharacterized protein n=1 Tax=Metarhizium album (strain ARSEF 1941) TaxID=1081103 RepID=A0A0B2WR64_METAS|nr:uncharacterized protein MAM_05957 [Metarhizium album ARSEF 1941]KHN96109.1 hypothetical protein MAM_05957 [Metarhizium album ARSEF 1941]